MNRFVPQRTYLKLAVLATVTILVFYAIVKQFDIAALPTLMAQTDMVWVVAGTLVGFATSPFLNTFRWQAILQGGGHRVGFKKIFLVTMANWPFMILPGRVGDLLKSYPLRHEVPVSHSIVSIVIEKIIDVLSLIGLIMAGSLILEEFLIFGIASAAFIGIIIIVALTRVVSTRILITWIGEGRRREALMHFDHILRSLIRHRKYFTIAIASSLGNWLTNVIAVWCFYKAFHLAIPFSAILAYLPISIFVGLLPITVAGMGTRDAVLIHFLSGYASATHTLGVGILYSMSAYWLPVLVGLCFMYAAGTNASFWPRNTDSQTTN